MEPDSQEPVTWLSGEIVTFLNKIGFILWAAAVGGAFAGVYYSSGHIRIAPVFVPFAVIAAIATAFMLWLSSHVQRIGYAGRNLVISNYSRQERIPFEQIEAIEPVWWNYRRMVRIRLRSSAFGRIVYYIPKWAAFRCIWVNPEKELRELLGR